MSLCIKSLASAAVLSACFAVACGGGDDGGGGSGTGGASTGGGGSGGSGGSGGAAGGSGSGGAAGTAGSGGATGACPGVKGSCTTGATCSEYGGTQDPDTFTSLETNCKDAKYTWSTGTCSETDLVGTCVYDTPNGPCNAILFYPPSAAAQSEAECTAGGGQWTAP